VIFVIGAGSTSHPNYRKSVALNPISSKNSKNYSDCPLCVGDDESASIYIKFEGKCPICKTVLTAEESRCGEHDDDPYYVYCEICGKGICRKCNGAGGTTKARNCSQHNRSSSHWYCEHGENQTANYHT